MLSFNGLLEEQAMLAEVSSAGKVKQFYWCFPTFSNLLLRKVIWNLTAALLSETGTVLVFLMKATKSRNRDWFLFGVKSMGRTRRTSLWIQIAGLTNETVKPYEERGESRWICLFAAYHLVPESMQAALAAGCQVRNSTVMTHQLLHVCDTLSFVLQAFPWGSKSLYLPSSFGKSWLGWATFVWNG